MPLTRSFKETCGSIWKAVVCRQWASEGRAGRPRSRAGNLRAPPGGDNWRRERKFPTPGHQIVIFL
jgi:hypothetical protein